MFEQALIKHFNDDISACLIRSTGFGEKYILTGMLETPAKENVLIKSIWFKSETEDVVKLVTAYPFRE